MEKITHPYIRKSVFSGVLDRNLRKLENRLGVSISLRGDSLLIDGPPKKVEFAKYYFEKMQELETRGCSLKEQDFHIALDLLEGGCKEPLESYFPSEALSLSRKSVSPKSLNQQDYIQAIRNLRPRLRHRPRGHRQDLPGHGHGSDLPPRTRPSTASS